MADDFAERRNAAQLSATRMLTGHGRPTQAAWLRELADWIEQAHGGIDPLPDRRGAGAEVTDLEDEVAELTGKPAAVLMPSGIMAQQAALRVWAENSGHLTVGMHDKSHFLVYELDALSELHGLRPVVVTEPPETDAGQRPGENPRAARRSHRGIAVAGLRACAAYLGPADRTGRCGRGARRAVSPRWGADLGVGAVPAP